MKVRLLYLVCLPLFLLTPGKSPAQALLSTAPFGTASPNLEPDGRRETAKISASEFVTITKVKGGTAGISEYVLEKFDLSLKSLFKVTLTAKEEEDYKDLFFNGKEIILFSVLRNVVAQQSTLMAYGFDPTTGQRKWEKTLNEFKVGPWAAVRYKGAVKETFDNAVGSCLPKNFVSPPQYQYEIQYSPDRKKVLIYIFDYAQKSLAAAVKLFDAQLNELTSGSVPVDNNFINYGIYPNNKGELFILNVDRLGRIVVVKYNIDSRDAALLDIQYASTIRESLRLQILNDDVVYVANINTKNGKLMGVMYSKFDFASNLIEKIHYHEISNGLGQTVKLLRQGNKSLTGEESWMNYEITDFFLNEYEKVVIALEKREISSINYTYEASGVNDIDKWKERAGRVSAETMLLFSFNTDDELLWEIAYPKSQVTDIASGLISASNIMDISDEGKIRMVYARSDNASGIFNTITYVEWDEFTGSRLKEVVMANDEKLSLMRNYTLWWEDKLVVAGRKGLFGKKSFIMVYKL